MLELDTCLFVDLQMHLVLDSINDENRLRTTGGCNFASDVFGQLLQGRRTSVKLGGHYPAVVLDAKPDSEPPALRCGVFLVPKVILESCSELPRSLVF